LTGSRGWSSPHWHYATEPETRAALELISSDHLCRNEPDIFAPLLDTRLTRGGFYMHLAALQPYLKEVQRLVELYADPDAWAREAVLDVARSGTLSSDCTIVEHAVGI
jgi:starch phosphorylase